MMDVKKICIKKITLNKQKIIKMEIDILWGTICFIIGIIVSEISSYRRNKK